MRVLLALWVVLLTTGCSKSVINFYPDSSLLVPCPPLEPFEGADMGDLIKASVKDAGAYKECARRMDGWILQYEEYRRSQE